MVILTETEVRSQPGLLAEAWTRPETFVLLPEKSSVSREWMDRTLGSLPEKHRRGCFALLTSGTTGQPKLVLGERDRAVALAEELHRRQKSEGVRESVSVLPLAYSYSFVNQWLWSHVHGRRLVLTPGFGEPKSVQAALEAAREAMVCMVGVQVPLLLSQCPGRVFPGMLRVHFAGGRFPQEKLEDLARMFPQATIFNNYGCAEAMPRLTVREAAEATEGANVGKPLRGIELATTEESAIIFRSPYGAIGVVEDHVFRPIEPKEWIPSGDLGQIEPDGALRLIGRNSEVFKRHGEKVSLATLASTVAAVWHGQLAFYREQDAAGEEGCVLALTPIADLETIRPVLMELRRRHPRAHWPLRIETLEVLPMLPNGKPDLRQIAASTEKKEIWKQHIK
jgi:long-chain acyl-CoA synthetase